MIQSLQDLSFLKSFLLLSLRHLFQFHLFDHPFGLILHSFHQVRLTKGSFSEQLKPLVELVLCDSAGGWIIRTRFLTLVLQNHAIDSSSFVLFLIFFFF